MWNKVSTHGQKEQEEEALQSIRRVARGEMVNDGGGSKNTDNGEE